MKNFKSIFLALVCMIFVSSYAVADCGPARVEFSCDEASGVFPLERRIISSCEQQINYVGGHFVDAGDGDDRYSLLVWASDASSRARLGVNNIVVSSFAIGDFSAVQDGQLATLSAVNDQCKGTMIEDGLPFQMTFGEINSDFQESCTFRIYLPFKKGCISSSDTK